MFGRAAIFAFAPNELLEITPEFLVAVLAELTQQGFDIVSIAGGSRSTAFRSARKALCSPAPSMTATRDNVDYAWPIFKQRGDSWTIFVTTEFADGRGRPGGSNSSRQLRDLTAS